MESEQNHPKFPDWIEIKDDRFDFWRLVDKFRTPIRKNNEQGWAMQVSKNFSEIEEFAKLIRIKK